MNTEERLKKAEDLIKELFAEMGGKKFTDKYCDLLAKTEQFLQPEINFDKMPVGTELVYKSNRFRFASNYSSTNIRMVVGDDVNTFMKGSVSLPDHQLSRIHKIPWPEDCKQPDFVKDDDLIIVSSFQNLTRPDLKRAESVNWIDERDYFAILNITDYRKI